MISLSRFSTGTLSRLRHPALAALSVCCLLEGLGCRSEKQPAIDAAIEPAPTVKAVKPVRRRIERLIAQPGVIEAYEQTSIYSRITGYVSKWHADVGDQVKKGELLAEIQIPDLVEELREKQALAEQARSESEQARRQLVVMERTTQAAADEIEEAQSAVKRFQADVDRWESEVARLTELAKDKVVDAQVLDETRNQLKASLASRDAAGSGVKTKVTKRLVAEAALEKAKTDARTAELRVKVADAAVAKIKAMLDYTRVTAPYDSVVRVRNVNTGDIVRPATGESTESQTAEGVSSSRATPLYVLYRTDKVMFVVGVPELDAAYVEKGTPAEVRIQALGNQPISATVSRTARALSGRSRTLQSQIDLPNPEKRILPGMYAYGTVRIERDNVLAIPASAVFESGNQQTCYLAIDGKAVRCAVQTGVSDGTWAELLRWQAKSPDGAVQWIDATGEEQVIVSDPAELTDGERVNVADAALRGGP